MEFDQEKAVFVVNDEERKLFRLPEGISEWPHAQVETLLGCIGLAELDLTDANPTALPPADRCQAVADMARRARLAREARHKIARYATLSDADFDQLLGMAPGEL